MRKYLEKNNSGNTVLPNLQDIAKASLKRKAYSNTSLPQETRKLSNKQPNLPSKEQREKNKQSPQSQQKERNIKDQKGNK